MDKPGTDAVSYRPAFRTAKNKDFVEQLTRRNMAAYYAQLGMTWDRAMFDAGWRAFDNYEMVVDGRPVGVLRLSWDEVACYIRDLQIEPAWHNAGLGTQAIEHAVECALEKGFKLLRLRVFCGNPAVGLYRRLGFGIHKTEGGTHCMERALS